MKYKYSQNDHKIIGMLKAHSPIYCMKHSREIQLDRIYMTNMLSIQCFQISLHNDDNECTGKRIRGDICTSYSQLDKPRLFLVATNRVHVNITVIINAIVLYILVFMYLLEIKLLLLLLLITVVKRECEILYLWFRSSYTGIRWFSTALVNAHNGYITMLFLCIFINSDYLFEI